MLGMEGWKTLAIFASITVVYSTLGGLKAVLITDFIQFIVAMTGSIWACVYILDLEAVGGLSNMLQHEEVLKKVSLLPDFSDPSVWAPILLVPLAVQWWAAYYPGAEPGGGGYIAQRMFSAKDEKNALGATLLYNAAHYALRPWPWILIALASIIVFPQLSDLQAAFPNLSADKLGHDVAYPAMLTFLPPGLLGLVAASIIAAFMSTLSTQLNLGASYLVNDFYKRFLNPDASNKETVNMGRFFTVICMVLGAVTGLFLTDAGKAFNLLLLLGAGTGLIYILRWFWWRINAFTEIVAMISSLIIAIYLTFIHDNLGFLPMEDWQKTVTGAVLTTITWIIATYLTPKTSDETLRGFYKLIKPAGPGWDAVLNKAKAEGVTINKEAGQLPLEILAMVIGCVTIYAALFATGFWVYHETTSAIIATIIAIFGATIIFRILRRLKFE